MLDAVSSQSFRLASGQMSPAGGSLGLPDEPRSCGGFATGPFCAEEVIFLYESDATVIPMLEIAIALIIGSALGYGVRQVRKDAAAISDYPVGSKN